MTIEVFVELRAHISQFQARMHEAIGTMAAVEKKGSSHFAALGKGAGLVGAGVATAAVGIAAASVKMAMNLQDANARLALAIKDSGHSMGDYQAAIAAADKHLEKFGFTNAQTNDALGSLTTALGDPSKALSALGTAADLAAFKHVDLSTASIAVAKAMEGNQRPLKQLGIDLPIVASSALKVAQAHDKLAKAQEAVNAILLKSPDAVNASSKAHAAYEMALGHVSDAQAKLTGLQNAGGQVIDALNRKIGGQAADAAGTFAGKLQVAKARTEDLGAGIGTKLIPIIEKAIGAVTRIVDWFGRHKTIAEALAVTVGVTLVAAAAALLVAWVADLTAMALATGGILLAVAAIGVAIFLIIKNWDAVYAWVKRNSPLIALAMTVMLGPIGAIGGAIILLGTNWKQIWTDMKQVAGAVVGFVIGDVIKPIINAFLTFAGAMIDTAAHAFGWVPGIGGKLKAAARDFHQFKDDTNATLQGWADSANHWGETFGANMMAGMGGGIQANLEHTYNLAATAAARVAAAMHKGIQAASPSKLTTETGRQLMAGLDAGMMAGFANSMAVATRASAGVAGQFGAGSSTAGPSSGAGGHGGGGMVVNVTVQGNVLSPDGLAASIGPAVREWLGNQGRNAVHGRLSST